MTERGRRFRAMAARIFDERTMERVVDPALADLQAEYADATRRGRMWRSRWILLTGYIAFLKTTVLCGARGAMRSFGDWTVEDRYVMSRTFWVALAAIAVATALLVMPPLLDAGSRFAVRLEPMLLIYLVPQALVLAVPVGLTLGIFLGLRGRAVSRRSTGAVLVAGILCSAACFVTLAWTVPAANQEFRVSVFAMIGRDSRTPAKTATELTSGELSDRIDRYSRAGLWVGNLLFVYHQRWAFSCATFVLALFALAVTRGLVTRRAAILAVFATIFTYYWLLWFGRALALRDSVPAFAGAWLANVVFIVAWIALRGRTEVLRSVSHATARARARPEG